MTEGESGNHRPVSPATQAVQDRRTQSKLRQKRILKRLIFVAYGILFILIALGVYDRVFSWDVADHTTSYFGKSDLVGQHTSDPVLYEQVPPVGGPHAGMPQACGFYDQFVNNENVVHSMEHGAVWIAYDPGLSAGDVDKLRELAANPYVLVSPYPGMSDKLTVTAWGHQMKLGSVDVKKIDAFRSKYGNNKDYSPEFGAACGPTLTAVTDEIPQQEPFVPIESGPEAFGGVTEVEATATAAASGEPAATPDSGS